MRFLKLGLISVIVIFLILTAMGFLLPAEVLVSRAVDIRGNLRGVKAQVFQLQNWQNWMTDAAGNKTTYTYNRRNSELRIAGTTVRPVSLTDSSFITEWTAGKGMLCTLRIIDHHRSDSLLTVQWQMEQRLNWYFWEKFAAITRDEIWGASMEKSLENLRTLTEISQ
ncbi:MAG TPA: hypothetical protein VF145_02355 [Chitinophagaceae bacterium]